MKEWYILTSVIVADIWYPNINVFTFIPGSSILYVLAFGIVNPLYAKENIIG